MGPPGAGRTRRLPGRPLRPALTRSCQAGAGRGATLPSRGPAAPSPQPRLPSAYGTGTPQYTTPRPGGRPPGAALPQVEADKLSSFPCRPFSSGRRPSHRLPASAVVAGVIANAFSPRTETTAWGALLL